LATRSCKVAHQLNKEIAGECDEVVDYPDSMRRNALRLLTPYILRLTILPLITLIGTVFSTDKNYRHLHSSGLLGPFRTAGVLEYIGSNTPIMFFVSQYVIQASF
jgi:uncharacterized membrane protein